MKFLTLMAATLVTISGCSTTAGLKQVSSGRVGCMPAEVEISNNEQSMMGQTWVATCKGKKFTCSSSITGARANNDITCAPMQQ